MNAKLTIEEAEALFERRRRAWLDEDVDAYLALWADDMVFQSPVHSEPLQRDEFAAVVRQSTAHGRPLYLDFHCLAVRGDSVLAEWSIGIERRDDGRRMEWRGMSSARLRDGLIVEWREYWNPHDLLAKA
jgi:ketosteroid isomerase-like protein